MMDLVGERERGVWCGYFFRDSLIELKTCMSLWGNEGSPGKLSWKDNTSITVAYVAV